MRHVFAAAAAFLATVAIAGSSALSATNTKPAEHSAELVARFGQEALDIQARVLQSMHGVQIRDGENGPITRLVGHTGLILREGVSGLTIGRPAAEVLEKIGPLLLASGTEELQVRSISAEAAKASAADQHRAPERIVRLEQYIRGREVLLGWVNLSIDGQTNEITTVAGNFLPDRGLEHEPKLTANEARRQIERRLREGAPTDAKISFLDAPARLAYAFEEIGDNGGRKGVLVWVFKVVLLGSATNEVLEASVSAATGEVIDLRSTTFGAINRVSYSAAYTAPSPSSFPSGLTFTFGEGGLPPDSLALSAYNNVGTTYNAYFNAFLRRSWNGADAPIRLVTHYLMDAGIAFYAPGGYLVFSDGMSGVVKSAAQDLDSVSHEFGHGVIDAGPGFETSILTSDGAAAINEAYGDWSATVADVYVRGTPGSSTWTMLELDPANPAEGRRYWNIPILADVRYRDWFPERSFISPFVAPGGQYLNSTIMGHAFYLLTNGGQHYRAGLPGSSVPVIPVTGVQYPTARNIFYHALSSPLLGPTSTFFDLRDATVAAASNPSAANSIRAAWNAVGVGYGCTAAPQIPQVQVWPDYCRGRHRITWNAIPGATKYHGQVTETHLGWGLAATVVDADVTQCRQNVPRGEWWIRVRACNGCGCSGWSPAGLMEYWNICQ